MLNYSALARDVRIDVKTARPGLNDYDSFKELVKLQKPVELGALLCLKPERLPLSREVVSIPVWEI